MPSKRELLIYLSMLSGVLALFFWPLLFQGYGYFHGDYLQQFYPWAYTLSRCLKSFSLPLWAPEIGCGFPLLAEGQSAALYPIHWVLFFLLPFPFSYHLGFLVLFALAGFFTYIFLRQCGLAPTGSAFAAAVFLFSSAYAGLFYGLMALRTLVWFPLSLYWIGKLQGHSKNRDMVFLGMTWAMSFLGGYPQMACYSVFAGFLYFIFRILPLDARERKIVMLRFVFAAALGAGLSAMQTLPTLELAAQSGRGVVGADFALQKSFNPFNIVTLMWPGFGAFMGFDFYIGLVPALLAFFSLSRVRKDRFAAFFAFQTAFFVLLALGRFNPVYVGLLKAFHLYSFRVPSKFIYFSCFSLAALSGIGLDLVCAGHSKFVKSFLGMARCVFIAAFGIFLVAWALIRFFRNFILEWGRAFVSASIFGKTGHPHSLDDYFLKLDNLLDLAHQRTDWLGPHFLVMLGLWAASFILISCFKAGAIKQKTFVLLVTALTLLDLYGYTFISTGFRGNRLPQDHVRADDTAQFLSSQKGLFRTYEAVTMEAEYKAPRWLPNSNMLFGYSSIGLYSPLAGRAYREYLEGSGAVDDAMGFAVTSKDFIARNLKRLGFMNVRYIIAHESLDGIDGLGKIFTAKKGDIVYLNEKMMPRAFFADPIEIDMKKKTTAVYRENLEADERKGKVKWLLYAPDKIMLETDSASNSFLFLSESYDDGWRLKIDGRSTEIYRTDRVFRGFPVPKGKHRIEFVYDPRLFKIGGALSLMTLAVCAVMVFR